MKGRIMKIRTRSRSARPGREKKEIMTNETVINNGEDQVTTAIGLRRGKGLGGGGGVVGRCAGTMVEAVVVAFKADSRASQYRTLSTLECKYWCRSYCSGVGKGAG